MRRFFRSWCSSSVIGGLLIVERQLGQAEELACQPAQNHGLDTAQIDQAEGLGLAHGLDENLGWIVDRHAMQVAYGAQRPAAMPAAEGIDQA